MDVKAIILVSGNEAGQQGAFAEVPYALVDVVGRPVVHHLVGHLQRQNVNEIAVISESPLPQPSASSRQEQSTVQWMVAEAAQLWRAAETCFNELAQNGAEEVLILRLGPYMELDVESLLQAHLDNRTHATRAIGQHGSSMDLFVVSASRRNEAAFLFRHRLQETRSRCGSWRYRGYWNALETPQHLRCMAVDSLLGENGIVPRGREVRPGVFIAHSARVHPRARILAPAYVGEYARIRCNAVVTRCSVVEHHAEVEQGTVVEDATVLPYTYIGPGLDIMRAVVGSGRVASLVHGVEVEIADPRLLRTLSPGAVRMLANAASLAAFLPLQVLRGLLRPWRRHAPADLPAAVTAPSSLNTPPGFPSAPSAVEASSYQRTWQ